MADAVLDGLDFQRLPVPRIGEQPRRPGRGTIEHLAITQGIINRHVTPTKQHWIYEGFSNDIANEFEIPFVPEFASLMRADLAGDVELPIAHDSVGQLDRDAWIALTVCIEAELHRLPVM